MNSALALRALLTLAFAALARAQCPAVDDAFLIDSMTGHGGCTPSEFNKLSRLRIEPWAVIWQPPFETERLRSAVCPEEIVSVYRRSNEVALIIWRKPVWAKHFEKSHPELYAQYKKEIPVAFPCTNLPIENITAWGDTRDTFMMLLSRMAAGIRVSREQYCDGSVEGPHGKKSEIPLRDVKFHLDKHSIATNALSYLSSVAYNNYFCLDKKAEVVMF